MKKLIGKLLFLLVLVVPSLPVAAVDFASFILTSPTLTTPTGSEYLPLALTGPATDKLSLTALTQWQWAQIGGVISVASNGSASFNAGTTGSGAVVLANNPTLVTPTLGVATATSINKLAITAPATGSTLAVADGKTLTANNTLTLAGTDGTTQTFPTTSASIARTDAGQTFTGTQTFSSTIAGSISGNAATVTTNANLTGPITSIGNTTSVASQTGTGSKFVMDTSPTLVTPTLGVATATSINKLAITAPATGSTLAVADGKTLTANNTLTLAGTDGTTQTFPTTSASIARTDAGQTFTGTQTFSSTIAGSISGNAATVTTNANLTGPITSIGNTTSVASQTGTGSKFVMDTSPTLVTPNIGAATGASLNVGTGALTGGLITGSSEILNGVRSETANYTVTTSDRTILADSTAGAITITLPSAVGISGFIITVKKIDATTNNVVITTSASQTIDGGLTQTLNAQYGGITMQSNGSNWYVLN